LRSYLARGTLAPQRAGFEEAIATVSPAHYFDSNDELVPADLSRGWPPAHCHDDALLYVRVFPKSTIDPLSESKTSRFLSENQVAPMRQYLGGGYSPARNRFGGIVYSQIGEERDILSATQLFRSRELWGIDADTLSHVNEHRGRTFQIIPSRLYEEVLENAVGRYLRLAQDKLAYSLPVVVEAGASNVRDFYMEMNPSQYLDRFWGPVTREHIQRRCELKSWDKEAVNEALLEIFDEFFDAVGATRPEDFRGFPTGARAQSAE
jgi:hypothetical protein